jgi:hypothetical protein
LVGLEKFSPHNGFYIAGDAGEMERALPEAGLLRLNRHHFRLDKGITQERDNKKKSDSCLRVNIT